MASAAHILNEHASDPVNARTRLSEDGRLVEMMKKPDERLGIATRISRFLVAFILSRRARWRRGYILALFKRMGNGGIHIGFTPEQAERIIFGDVIGFKSIDSPQESGASSSPAPGVLVQNTKEESA